MALVYVPCQAPVTPSGMQEPSEGTICSLLGQKLPGELWLQRGSLWSPLKWGWCREKLSFALLRRHTHTSGLMNHSSALDLAG